MHHLVFVNPRKIGPVKKVNPRRRRNPKKGVVPPQLRKFLFKKRRSNPARRRRNASLAAVAPMKSNPRRRHRRRRNPARVAAVVRSNPRRRHRRRRNPVATIYRRNPEPKHRSGRHRKSHRYGVSAKSLLASSNLKIAGGALGSVFLVNFVNNYLMTNMLASTFSTSSALTKALVGGVIKAGIGYGTAYLVEKKSPELAQGIFLGALIVAGSDVLNATLAGTSIGAQTTSAYLGRNLGSMPFQVSKARVPVSRKVGQYMQPGGNVRSLVGPVSPTAKTFATGMGSIYGGTSAFRQDAWTRQ